MKYFTGSTFVYVLMLCMAGHLTAGAGTLKTKVDDAEWRAALAQKVEALMQRSDVPGVSLAVVRDGEIVYSQGFGVKNAKKGGAVTRETVFQAASLSKPVFAYAVLRLVDRGVLDLDTPLEKYLRWDEPVRDDIKAEHYVNARKDPRFNRITARHALTHTIGFPNWSRRAPLEFNNDPGDVFSYSGEGFVLLQKAVSDLTGKTLHELVKQEVFEPLGMTHAAFEWRDELKDRYADGHFAWGEVSDYPPSKSGNAAAGLLVSAEEYARFVIALLQGKGLKAATLKEMMTPQIQLSKGAETNRVQFKDLSWGLGWGLENTAEGTAFWHWGDQGVFRNWVEMFPEQKLGLVFLCNSNNGLALRNDLVAAAIGGEHPAYQLAEYRQHDAPDFRFNRMVLNGEMEKALAYYRELQAGDPQKAPIHENLLNGLGYNLMGRLDRIDDALTIFELNVAAQPKSYNAYDSLGEAYMKKGEREQAIKNYRKSLELNPDNDNAVEMIKKLEEAAK